MVNTESEKVLHSKYWCTFTSNKVKSFSSETNSLDIRFCMYYKQRNYDLK